MKKELRNRSYTHGNQDLRKLSRSHVYEFLRNRSSVSFTTVPQALVNRPSMDRHRLILSPGRGANWLHGMP